MLPRVEAPWHTYATAKLVVPAGTLRVTLPELSVAAVNDPDPIWVATAVGVPANLTVTIVRLAGQSQSPFGPEPPQPDIARHANAGAKNIMYEERIHTPVSYILKPGPGFAR